MFVKYTTEGVHQKSLSLKCNKFSLYFSDTQNNKNLCDTF